jgi:hypothetical protein
MIAPIQFADKRLELLRVDESSCQQRHGVDLNQTSR